MNTMLELLFTLAVAGSVVTVCNLFLRKIPVHMFPAKWRYRLQKIAILLYLLPVAVGISWIFPLIDAHTTTTTVHNSPSIAHAGFIPDSFVSLRTIPAIAALILLSIWAIGAIGFAARQLYDYRRFTAALSRTSVNLTNRGETAVRLSFLKEELGLKIEVALAGSSIVRSPVLAGLRQPTIYLPQALGREVDLDMVLRHELMHLKRKDLWIKAFALVVGALHWYNPLVHLLRKEIQLWSELSCDEEVVVGMSYAERKRYGSTLLNVVAGSGNLPMRFCASLSGDGKQLKRRLTLMLNVKKLKKKTMFLTVSAVFLIAAVSTTAAVWASDNTPTVVAQEEAALSEAETATAAPAAAGAAVTGPAPTVAAASEAAASSAGEPHATAAPAAAQASEAPSDEVHAVPTATASPMAAQATEPLAESAPADDVHAVPQATAAPAAIEATVTEPQAVPSKK
ncbi:M56 family metallopeptidase [Cohnella sp. GCM10012308]|uniref:M56 family metallopeptidase n=1 Tax=Cohnella sp. GCM10012308 TaxID=3317329 RepID=UPI003605E1AB